MNENTKISVKDYLENKELLQLNYVPYETKKDICKVILEQCAGVTNDYYVLNSVLLDRVKKEIFITSISNLDFSIKNEIELDGYDQLCLNDELDELIDVCGYLYDQFDKILELMLKDYYDNEMSLRGYLHRLKLNIIRRVQSFRKDITDYIDNLDAKEIADNIINIIENSKSSNK